MRDISEIIIHCTATPEGKEVSVDTIRNWHQAKGWQDIGYHYIIQPNGRIDNGRPISLPGAHCVGHNKNSIGIALVGGMTADGKHNKNTMTMEQEHALVALIKTLREAYPIRHRVYGHNEFSNKRCPCFDVQHWKETVGL